MLVIGHDRAVSPGALEAVREPLAPAVRTADPDALAGRTLEQVMAGVFAAGRRSAPTDPGFWRTTTVGRTGTSSLPRPFAQHPGLYGIVHKLAMQAATAPFQIGTWDAEGAFRPDEHSDLGEAFANPNRALSATQLWYLRAVYLYLFGEAFFLLDRDNATEVPRAIGVVPGGRLWKPVLGTDRLPVGWVWKVNDEEIPYEPWQVVQFRFANPYDAIRGMAPAEVAALLIDRDVLADRHEKSLLENNAIPGGFILYPENVRLTPQQYDRLKAEFADRHQGPGKAGRFAILDNGAQFEVPQQTLAELEFVMGRKFNLTQLCLVMGVDKWFVGETDALPYANAREARQGLWEDTIIPLLRDTNEVIKAQVLQFFPGNAASRFATDEVPAMKAARRARIDDLNKLLAARMSLKQASKMLDLDVQEEPGWDVPWVGLGMSPITSALAAAEEPPPAPGAEPTMGEDQGDQGDEEPAETDVAEAKVAARIATLPKAERATAAQRHQLWRKWNRLVLEVGVARYQAPARRWLTGLADEIVETFDRLIDAGRRPPTGGTRDADLGPEAMKALAEGRLFDQAVANQALVTSLRPAAFEVAGLSGAFTAGELGPWAELDLTSDAVQHFLNERMALLSDYRGGIAARTRARLAKSLQAGLAKNESVAELRVRVQEMAKALRDPARAMNIARTEAGVVANSVRMIAAQDAAAGWTWGTSDDDVVRATHAQAEIDTTRSPVPMGGAYALPGPNGQVAEMRWPGDPAAPAWATAQCRCFPILLPKEAA